jgi:hypothetical protein
MSADAAAKRLFVRPMDIDYVSAGLRLASRMAAPSETPIATTE